MSVRPPERRPFGGPGRALALAPVVSQVGHHGLTQGAITRDPEVMHATPLFRGTRVAVKTLFDYLENGDAVDDLLEGLPM